MRTKDLLSIEDLSVKEIRGMLSLAKKLKKRPLLKKKALKNKTFGLLFQKPSNRTRVSFEIGIVHLGGYALYLSPQEIRMGERESVKDVAHVISRYVDGVIARVYDHEDIVLLARHSDAPVINGLSDREHPCQALGDMLTISERIKDVSKATVSFVGDGNNVLQSLMLICAKMGTDMRIATPQNCGPEARITEIALEEAEKSGSRIKFFEKPEEAVAGADFVYTDVWISMGEEGSSQSKMALFKGFQVNAALMAHAKPGAYIMHCLPAHRGEEVDDIIDGKSSIIYDQAENRMHAQKAVMLEKFTHRRR